MSTHSNVVISAEVEGLEPPSRFTDQLFSRQSDYQLSHTSKKELENFSRFTSTSFLLYITGEHIRLSINSSLYLTKIMSFQQTLPLHLSFHLSYTSQVQT